MKLAFSNIGWKNNEDAQMYWALKNRGFAGLEIAPTHLYPENPYDNITKIKDLADNLKDKMGIEICSMQSIWYGCTENIFDSADKRSVLTEYTCHAVDFANAAGCKNLVFGCPKNRNMPSGADPEIAEHFLTLIGQYAATKGCIIALEANPTIYNTNFLNTTKQAFDMAEKLNCKGIGVNLDFGTIIQNEEDFDFIADKIDLISHVHISEPYLAPIKQRPEHKRLAQILKSNNYKNFVSGEVSAQSPTVIMDIMDYLKEVFK